MGHSSHPLEQKLLVTELEIMIVNGRNRLQQERKKLPELGFQKGEWAKAGGWGIYQQGKPHT